MEALSTFLLLQRLSHLGYEGLGVKLILKPSPTIPFQLSNHDK